MAKILCDPIQKRCPKCSTRIEYEPSDYTVREFGTDGFTCPVCSAAHPHPYRDLPLAWRAVISPE